MVEDDPAIRRLLRKYLEKLDLEVTEADNGKAALASLEKERFSLVCLDLMLPEASGLDLCSQIRKMPGLESVPVLVVSSRSLPQDRALAEEVGSNGYLIKPVRWNLFSATVRLLVDGA